MMPVIEPLNSKFHQCYVDYVRSKVSKEDEAKFIQGVELNLRPWEYSLPLLYGGFADTDKVLDTGAMHTFYAIYLAKFVEHVWATDSYYWAQRDYASRLPSPTEWEDVINRSGEGKITAEHADLQELKYPSDYFDKITCISTIEHVVDDKKAMKEIKRILKPDGLLLLTTEYNYKHSLDYSEEAGYLRIYNEETLADLCQDYKLEKLRVNANPELEPGKFVQAFVKLRK